MADTQLVELRNLQASDYKELAEAMKAAYVDIDEAPWDRKQIEKLLRIFPEGQICVLVNNKVAAAALSILVDYDTIDGHHTYAQITGDYSFDTHRPKGNVMYGIDLFVHPEFRGLRLGRRLYDARKELCENLNLRGIMAGGRIPNYEKFSHELTPREYIDKVDHKEIFDPALTFQLSNDFYVKRILKGYYPEDSQSKQYATLLEWSNIYYEKEDLLLTKTKSVVRLGLVQWQMRPFKDFESLMRQAEFFVDALSDYQSDFILFPEYLNAPLMAEFNHLDQAHAIRELAKFAPLIQQRFGELAVSYNINIITGSIPILEDGILTNISYLCRRDGTWDSYSKIHITPNEVQSWGMSGGDKIRVFDTDCGKIGILVCYDVEFPELSRIYADQGAQILFVPFQTDTQNGYTRVRHCAQARAIENECYVAIAGSVGNLPRVSNMDIQYAQSAVFTPSDFSFPNNAIKAECTPNTEMTLIADVDLDLLKELHVNGSVRTLLDRRNDLYQVKAKKKSRT